MKYTEPGLLITVISIFWQWPVRSCRNIHHWSFSIFNVPYRLTVDNWNCVGFIIQMQMAGTCTVWDRSWINRNEKTTMTLYDPRLFRAVNEQKWQYVKYKENILHKKMVAHKYFSLIYIFVSKNWLDNSFVNINNTDRKITIVYWNLTVARPNYCPISQESNFCSYCFTVDISVKNMQVQCSTHYPSIKLTCMCFVVISFFVPKIWPLA